MRRRSQEVRKRSRKQKEPKDDREANALKETRKVRIQVRIRAGGELDPTA